MLKPLDPSVLEEGQRKFREEFTVGPSVRALNIDNVSELSNATEFEWPKGSGNVYVVERVPYPDGIRLNDLFYRILESKKYESPVMLPVLERQLSEIIRIMWRLTQPRGRAQRLRKKLGLMKNPFYAFASEGEIASLIAFFLVRRMTSSVYIRPPAETQTRRSR